MFVVSLLELSPLCLHMYPNVFRTHVEVGDVKQCPTIHFYLGSMNYIEKSRKCIDYDKKKIPPIYLGKLFKIRCKIHKI